MTKSSLDLIRNLACLVCRNSAPNDPHHIKTKGSGGSDSLTNLMPLCRLHHSEIHTMGLTSFAKKYINVKVWLQDMGWNFNGRKWVNYNNFISR